MTIRERLARIVELTRTADALASEVGLTPPQAAVVYGILHHGGRAATGNTASAAGVAFSSMTSMVDRLEGKNLLRRERDSEDRRVVYLTLTDDCYGLLGLEKSAVR